jgi:transcription initiation factor TFIIIB Brf1 subunit/transcription initiation factor TFIIB
LDDKTGESAAVSYTWIESTLLRFLERQSTRYHRTQVRLEEIIEHLSKLAKEFSQDQISRALVDLESKRSIVRLQHYDWIWEERPVKYGIYRQDPQDGKSEFVELGEVIRRRLVEDKKQPRYVTYALRNVLVERGGICPECDSDRIEYDFAIGETCCRSCGFVMSEKDMTADYRAVSPPRDPLRFNYSEIRRLRKEWPSLYRWRGPGELLSTEERDTLRFLARLNRLSEVTNAPLVVRMLAYAIYKAAYRDRLLSRGVSRETHTKAALVLAHNTLTIPFREEMISADYKEQKRIRASIKRLGTSQLVVGVINPFRRRYGVIEPEDCLPHIVRNLNAQLTKEGRKPMGVLAQERLMKDASEVLKVMQLIKGSRGSPYLSAAVALWDTLQYGEMEIRQSRLAKAAAISTGALSRRYGELRHRVSIFAKSASLAQPVRLRDLVDVLQCQE